MSTRPLPARDDFTYQRDVRLTVTVRVRSHGAQAADAFQGELRRALQRVADEHARQVRCGIVHADPATVD